MGPTLPFRLKVPGRDAVDGLGVSSTSFRVHGYLEVEGDTLVIEWGGTARVQEVKATTVRDDTEPLPDERLVVPAADLYRAELTGGWFRPRLRVQARRVGALAPVPSERFGAVDFWYDRSERFTAIEVARALREAIDAAERQAYDDEVGDTPPGGRSDTR
jgi:hypothetical protein